MADLVRTLAGALERLVRLLRTATRKPQQRTLLRATFEQAHPHVGRHQLVKLHLPDRAWNCIQLDRQRLGITINHDFVLEQRLHLRLRLHAPSLPSRTPRRNSGAARRPKSQPPGRAQVSVRAAPTPKAPTGWTAYQGGSGTYELWLDEIAIDHTRIGCEN